MVREYKGSTQKGARTQTRMGTPQKPEEQEVKLPGLTKTGEEGKGLNEKKKIPSTGTVRVGSQNHRCQQVTPQERNKGEIRVQREGVPCCSDDF